MGNHTIEYSTDDPRSLVDFVGLYAMVIIGWVIFVPTMIAFSYGVISWCLLKKFRHFRNYVIISAITANLLRLGLFEVSMAIAFNGIAVNLTSVRAFLLTVVAYCSLIFNCWLLVLCYIFYMDFVKVFRTEIRRRYLKSSLFAWGLPIVVSLLYYGAGYYYFYDRTVVTLDMMLTISLMVFSIPIFSNLVIYILVLVSLFRSKDTSAGTSTNKWRRFYISALIFVLSGVMMLPTLVQLLEINLYYISLMGEMGDYINLLAVNVYIIIVKSNRDLWREYFDKRSKRNKNTLGMKGV